MEDYALENAVLKTREQIAPALTFTYDEDGLPTEITSANNPTIKIGITYEYECFPDGTLRRVIPIQDGARRYPILEFDEHGYLVTYTLNASADMNIYYLYGLAE